MIRKVNEKKVRLRIGKRTWTGQLLILLALSSLGCAPGDWTSQTLTLVDVTGTWEGPFQFHQADQRRLERMTRWVLQQKGGKVRGEAQGLDGTPFGSVEGLVNGEVFSWRFTGQFLKTERSTSYRGEATVAIDEMSGRADGVNCPCSVLLRRVGSDTSGKKAQ